MRDLDILIPSRNEEFLNLTIQDILKHIEGDTGIIVILDGSWPIEPIPDNPRVTIIHHSESIGQRAATNEAARLSQAKYLMKCDAHCAFDQGFDVKLMADMQDHYTMVPIMRNLWVFDWVCPNGHRRYQGISGPCKECGEPTHKEIKWIPKTNPQSTAYRFDTSLHFQYWSQYKKRAKRDGNLTETLSLQGSCFLMTRERYHALNICDEAFGSWGQQGTEVAVKSWLSGGRVVVNHSTFHGHLFRTAGGDFGFPYALSGKQVDYARKYSQDLFLDNKWPQQVYPLSWLLDKFKPIPEWHEEAGKSILARVTEAGVVFPRPSNVLLGVLGIGSAIPGSMTDHATPVPIDWGREKVPVAAMGLSGVSGSRPIPFQDIDGIGEQLQMNGVAAESIPADMIQDGDILTLAIGDRFDQPSIHESMGAVANFLKSEIAIPTMSGRTSPNPAPSLTIDANLAKDTHHRHQGNVRDNQHFVHTQNIPSFEQNVKSKGIVYYTDNRLDPTIMSACQRQLLKAGLPITAVSLQPVEGFGTNIVMDLERGPLTLLKQQLAGVEASDADYIWFCEHDVLYDASHFEFCPPRDDTFYYNTNVWKVRLDDGHAVWTDNLQQTSGLCAKRQLLLDYLHTRIAHVEANGFDRHYEPGPKTGDWKAENWKSAAPNLDIRHGLNLTRDKWHPSEFRNQRYARGWKEADEVEPWYRKGEFQRLLDGGRT